MKDILYKSQSLWNIALFVLDDADNIFDFDYSIPYKRFSPQNLIRTSYHQISGYADPFLFVHPTDGYLYLFYEEERLLGKAPICAYRTCDLEHWENLGVVLRESCHLSYPNVFAYGDDIYMIPETRERGAVILYKATEFPYKWEEAKILLNADKYVDSTLFFHNNLWYLFTTVWYGKNDGLHIYTSPTLLGDYIEHAMSPVTHQLTHSRCGGSIICFQNELYRPAQKCDSYYGENIQLYKIDQLSPMCYQEHKTQSMINIHHPWSIGGGHHFNTVEFKGKRVVVMDGIVNDNWINNHTRKFYNLAHKYLSK